MLLRIKNLVVIAALASTCAALSNEAVMATGGQPINLNKLAQASTQALSEEKTD